MHQYGVRDVEKLLRLPRSTIRSLIAAGFISPARGPRGSLRFSFQDMIVLRTAQTLADAKVPPRRITRSLKELRQQLPDAMPLSGLSIGAVGEHVVVRDGSGQRHADSGQYLLAFEGDPQTGDLRVIERRPAAPQTQDEATDVQDWLDQAAALEAEDVDASVALYRKAIEADPECFEAQVNLGRLLHEAGRLAEAEAVYRDALRRWDADPLLSYNLGVLLEDRGCLAEAAACYEAALRGDPELADAYYNLALLCRKLDRPHEAIRHMSQYRRLLGAEREPG
ncbi:MAG: tetratricopeptide repeat protein [Gammaproteobacteria bacterium]